MRIPCEARLIYVLLVLLTFGCSDDVQSQSTGPFQDSISTEGVSHGGRNDVEDIPPIVPDTATENDAAGLIDTAETDIVTSADTTTAADSAATSDAGSLKEDATEPETPDTGVTEDGGSDSSMADTFASGDSGGGPGTADADGNNNGLLCGLAAFNATMVDNAAQLESEVLMSQLPDLTWVPSTIYKWADLIDALHVICTTGLGGFNLWTGSQTLTDEEQSTRALVNVAAFLAQSMKETIRYDACDENNWDDSNGYLLSNACVQLGQNYADYDCDMACPQDLSMTATAVTNAKWYGAPGPLFCAPDTDLIAAGVSTNGDTGRWDYNSDCWPYPATEPEFMTSTDPAWLRPECQVYAGQKGGKYVFDGSGGSVEGCCWWGRGVIQTTGRCNFGILNHYLGATHLNPADFPPPASAPYPEIDFCKQPEAICSSTAHPELKWIAGLFYWMASVQTYDADGWVYIDQLDQYVSSGLVGDAFIDSVSGIVNRGCHDAPCETGAVDGLEERRANFNKVLEGFGLK